MSTRNQLSNGLHHVDYARRYSFRTSTLGPKTRLGLTTDNAAVTQELLAIKQVIMDEFGWKNSRYRYEVTLYLSYHLEENFDNVIKAVHS